MQELYQQCGYSPQPLPAQPLLSPSVPSPSLPAIPMCSSQRCSNLACVSGVLSLPCSVPSACAAAFPGIICLIAPWPTLPAPGRGLRLQRRTWRWAWTTSSGPARSSQARTPTRRGTFGRLGVIGSPVLYAPKAQLCSYSIMYLRYTSKCCQLLFDTPAYCCYLLHLPA